MDKLKMGATLYFLSAFCFLFAGAFELIDNKGAAFIELGLGAVCIGFGISFVIKYNKQKKAKKEQEE